jgi:hypothetical protein
MKKYNVGIVGYSWAAEAHIRAVNLTSNAQVTAICSSRKIDPAEINKKHSEPPSPEEFRKLTTRIVDLHPVTCMQNARTSAGGVVMGIPSQALTVGPIQTWKAEKVSIWQAGKHDNPFGQRLTALMIRLHGRVEKDKPPNDQVNLINIDAVLQKCEFEGLNRQVKYWEILRSASEALYDQIHIINVKKSNSR